MSKIFNILLLCLLHTLHSSNGEWVENKGLWYYISRSEQHVGYEKAVDICDTLNARLAVITSLDQNEFLERKINDWKYRWIGLSKGKTDLHNNEYCENATFVWNKDIYCDTNVTLSNLLLDIGASEQLGCSGVTFRNQIWTAKDCMEHHGFICQWECKRIYMHFEDRECSGVYTFDSYYNNNVAYYQEQNRNCRIYRSKSQGTWAVTNENMTHYWYLYFHRPNLFVPYGETMSWETAYGKGIRAGSFCIECEHLNVCLSTRQGEEICPNDMHMITDSVYPKYTNNDSSVVIMYNMNHYCMGTDDIGKWCTYIFPYPQKTSNYTLKNHDTLSITNGCNRDHIEIPITLVSSPTAKTTVSYPSQITNATGRQTSIDEYSTSTYETTSKPHSAQKSTQNNKTIALSVSIAGVVIAIIIVAVIVSIIFVRRWKRKRQYDEDPGGKTTRDHHITDAQFNNNAYLGIQESNTPINVYLELQGSNLKNTVVLQESNSMQNITDLPKKHFNSGDYSYAKCVTPETGQVSKEIAETSTLEEKPPIATTNEVAQNKGYLAPDYGILMDRNAKQADKGHANNNIGTNEVYLETSDSKAKSISQSPGESGSDYDLQLHENEVYDTSADSTRPNNPKNENVYYSDVNADVDHGINQRSKQSNEGSVYKNAISDTTEEGDDDLELFENSVYEQTQ